MRGYMVGRSRPKRPPIPRVIYWIVGISSLALISGFAIGAVTLGTFGHVPRQASATSLAPAAPAGVSFPLVEATMVTASSSPAVGDCVTSNLGTNGTPTDLTDGTNTTICLSTSGSGFALGDLAYILDVAWDTTSDVSTHFEVQVFFSVLPAANDLLETGYVSTSATIATGEVAVFALDLTQSGDTSVNGFSVIVTEL